MTVAINARAAMRAEIGGVERHALEMAARLPALVPGRYRVIRPPRAFAHRAGHAWEQAWLPFGARGAELLYSPANLAPAASRKNVVVIHDVSALRHPEWFGRAYVAWQRALLPRLARRARLILTVSEFSRGELVEVLGADPARVAVAPGGRERALLAGCAGSRGAPVRPDGGHADRAQEPGGARAHAGGTGGARDRPRGRRLGPLLHARRGRRPALARLRAGARPAGAVRGRERVRAALAVRGLRPHVPRGDGERHAGRGRRPRRAARDLRRRRAAGGPDAAGARSPTRCWPPWARSTTASPRRGSRAPLSSRGQRTARATDAAIAPLLSGSGRRPS